MKRFLKYYRGKKGMALVWIALLLAVLLFFAATAIDISYMYYVKNQLTVAADAAALAGVALLNPVIDDSTDDYAQLPARQKAWEFACKNEAAGDPVYLVKNSSTDCDTPPSSGLNEDSNSATGDIVVGNWNSTTRIFTPANNGGTATGLLINAIKTRPQRTEESASYGMPKADVFVGHIFKLIDIDWSAMSARAESIASKTGGLPTIPLPLCLPECDNVVTDFNNPNCPGKKYIFNPPDAELLCGVAWARLEPCPPNCQVPTKPYIEDKLEYPESENLCGLCIKTKQGAMTASLNDFENAFNDNKETITITYIDEDNPSSNWESTVVGWKILIPIIREDVSLCGAIGPNPCPGDGPTPYYVDRMAEVIVTKVDTAPADSCWTCGSPPSQKGITFIGTNPTSTAKVTKISCLSCDPPDPSLDDLAGVGQAKLVK